MTYPWLNRLLSTPPGVREIRLLSKPAYAREIGGDSERTNRQESRFAQALAESRGPRMDRVKTGVYTRVHEDSSTESTNKFSAKVGFGKKSIEGNSKQNFVPVALIGLTISIPTTISLTSIFWVLSLVLILLTPEHRDVLPKILKSPLAWFSIGLFIVAFLGCFWGEASWHAKFTMLSKYLKFLFFPLLIAGFTTKKIRPWVMHTFLGVMLLTSILSFFKWTGILIWRSADPGEVFYNHIMTGLMMSYAAYMALWLAYTATKQLYKCLYSFLFILFTLQIFFLSPGRTGYVIYLVIMSLFLLQIFPLRKALIAICIGGILFGAAVYQSPVVKEGIYNISHDLLGYKNHYLRTSLGYRIQFHNYSKELFYRHWLVGNGTAGFEHAFHTENPVPGWTTNYLSEPHSQYWLILSEFGLFGFSVFCLFLFFLVREIISLKKMRILAIGILAIFLVGNFSDSLFFYSTTNLFFMTMMAMCLGEKYEN